MANRTLNPELEAAVKSARSAAIETGELRTTPAGSPASPFAPDARDAVAAWHASGEYDQAVAELVADDPDVATQ